MDYRSAVAHEHSSNLVGKRSPRSYTNDGHALCSLVLGIQDRTRCALLSMNLSHQAARGKSGMKETRVSH
jgi:hypothetical protein